MSSHSSTISSPIATLFIGLSPNPQVFNPDTQTFPPNQTEWGDVGESKEDVLGDDNFLVFLPYNVWN